MSSHKSEGYGAPCKGYAVEYHLCGGPDYYGQQEHPYGEKSGLCRALVVSVPYADAEAQIKEHRDIIYVAYGLAVIDICGVYGKEISPFDIGYQCEDKEYGGEPQP